MNENGPGIIQIFLEFFRISALTIGGGYVMIPAIQRALEKKHWLSETEFYDLFAAAQSIPGPLALNTAMFVGRRIAGLPGFFAAMTGVIIPPFVSILLFSRLLGAAGKIPFIRGFLEGSYAVVPGLVAALAFNMIKKRSWNGSRIVLTIIGAAGIILAGSFAVPAFFTLVGIAWIIERTAC
jgi:chromate transporter